MTVDATRSFSDTGVRILDPHSTLISPSVKIEPGTVVYPNVVIQCDGRSVLEIGADNLLYPGTMLLATDGGTIQTGCGCELGPGGALVRAEGNDAEIVFGDEVRVNGGCDLTGRTILGRGAQILGQISARSVRLGGGHGGHRWPVPDERGAVLKGTGIAVDEVLSTGDVKSCRPTFADAPIERQSSYH